MAQNISLYVLSLIDKQVYTIQNVTDAGYLRTLKEIRVGDIGKVLNFLDHVDCIIKRIEKDIKNYSRDTSNKMKKVRGKGCCSHRFEAEVWTSEVEWEISVSEE